MMMGQILMHVYQLVTVLPPCNVSISKGLNRQVTKLIDRFLLLPPGIEAT